MRCQSSGAAQKDGAANAFPPQATSSAVPAQLLQPHNLHQDLCSEAVKGILKRSMLCQQLYPPLTRNMIARI